MKTYIAPIFGVAAMVCLFLIYQQKTRKRLLLCKLGADICWVVYYFCHGAVGGLIPNFVGIVRESVFLSGEKRSQSKVLPAIFIIINWAIAFWKKEYWYDFIPICASTFVTISLWVKSPKLTRIISAPVSAAFIIYDILAGAWIGVVNDSVGLISCTVSLLRKDLNKEVAGKD